MPITADVDLANLALISLGDKPIVSLDDASNDPDQAGPDRAVIMKTLFNPTREAEFERYPWNCLIRRAELVEVLPVPVFGYAHAYQLPQGQAGAPPYCLRVIDTSLCETWGESGWWAWGGWGTSWGVSRDGRWAVEGRTLVTHAAAGDDGTPIKIRYIGLELDVTTYSPSLVHILHRALAWQAAGPMGKGADVIDQMDKQYQRTILVGRAINGQEHGLRTNRNTELTRVRR